MNILRELWTDEKCEIDVKTTYEYVIDLRNRLEETCEMAKSELEKSQETYKKHFDKSSKPRKLEIGNKVLLLLPTDNNKLLLQWKGPYEVKGVKGLNDYFIDVDGTVRLYHINMLKRFYELSDEPNTYDCDISCLVAAISETDCDLDGNPLDEKQMWESPEIETFRDVNISPDLSDSQKRQLESLISKYQDIFSSNPGRCNMWSCDINLSTDKPIRAKQYPIPYSLVGECKSEIQRMLDLGVVEFSTSPYRATHCSCTEK